MGDLFRAISRPAPWGKVRRDPDARRSQPERPRFAAHSKRNDMFRAGWLRDVIAAGRLSRRRQWTPMKSERRHWMTDSDRRYGAIPLTTQLRRRLRDKALLPRALSSVRR